MRISSKKVRETDGTRESNVGWCTAGQLHIPLTPSELLLLTLPTKTSLMKGLNTTNRN